MPSSSVEFLQVKLVRMPPSLFEGIGLWLGYRSASLTKPIGEDGDQAQGVCGLVPGLALFRLWLFRRAL